MKTVSLRYLPLLIIIGIIASFYYFHLYDHFTLEYLRAHRLLLLQWTENHYVLTVCCYTLLYITLVAVSIPASLFLSITGGFLFGITCGTLFAIVSATIGGTLFFIVARTLLKDWLMKKTGKWLEHMEKGFQQNAFHYLLTLRLIPIIPFWIVNLVSALMNVRLITFMSATIIGMIGPNLIYASIGNGLGKIFDSNQTMDLHILFQPHIYLPLAALAGLAILSVAVKGLRKA